QVAHCSHKSQRACPITRIESTGDDRSGPTTHTRQDCDVLLTVRTAITDWLTNNSRAAFELPQHLSASRIDCLEPAIHRSVKDDVARRHHSATPHRKDGWLVQGSRCAKRTGVVAVQMRLGNYWSANQLS